LILYEAGNGDALADLSLAENPFLDRATHGYFDHREMVRRVSDLMRWAESFGPPRALRCRYFGRFSSHDHLLADMRVREGSQEAHCWLALGTVLSFAWHGRSDHEPRFDVRAVEGATFSVDIGEGRDRPSFAANALALGGTVSRHGEKAMPLPLDDPKARGRVTDLDQ
jgi:hypothetical protein